MYRSRSPNGDLIRSIRDQLRWTQEKLASHAGLSVRVVAKAEAGGAVSEQTIACIGAAFRHAGVAVGGADLIICPSEVIRQLLSHYRATEAATIDAPRRLFSEGVTAYVDGDPSWLKIAGEHRGVDEVDLLWSLFFAGFDIEQGTLGSPSQLVIAGHRVLTWGHEWLRGSRGLSAPPLFILLRAELSRGRVAACWIHFDGLGLGVRMERQLNSTGNGIVQGVADGDAIRRNAHWIP